MNGARRTRVRRLSRTDGNGHDNRSGRKEETEHDNDVQPALPFEPLV